MQHGTGRPGRPKAQGPIQRVGQRLDALMRQRLKTQGQIGPAEQRSCGERHLNGIRVGIGRTYELLPDFISEIHHLDDDMFRQGRMELHQQSLFHYGIRVIDLAQHETIKPREIHSAGSLIESRIIPSSVGVARADDTEHFMRMNDFPTVFRQAQRRTFQNTVETHSNLW